VKNKNYNIIFLSGVCLQKCRIIGLDGTYNFEKQTFVIVKKKTNVKQLLVV